MYLINELLFFASLIGMLVVVLVSFSSHQYNKSVRKYSYVAYVVAGVVVLSESKKYFELFDLFPLFFFLMLLFPFGYSFGFLLAHYSMNKRFKRYTDVRFNGAEFVPWNLVDKQKELTVMDHGVFDTKKLGSKENEVFFETRFDEGFETNKYFNDFAKRIQVIDGEIELVYVDSTEVLTVGMNTNIRPYEVHKIKTLKRAKLLVNCVK